MTIHDTTKAIVQQLEQLSQTDHQSNFVTSLVNRSLESTLTEIRAIQENAEFWNTLVEINQLSDGTDRRELLNYIAGKVKKLLSADIVIIYEGIKEGQFVSPKPGIAGELNHPQHMENKIRESDVVFRILEQDEPYYSSHSQEDTTLVTDSPYREAEKRERFVIRENIRSTASIPLKIKNENVGVIFVNYRSSQPFDEQQKQTIEAVAEHTAIAVHNMRLLRRQIRHGQDLTQILQIMGEITLNIVDTKAMLQAVIEQLVDLIQVPRGAIALWSADGGVVVAEHKIEDDIPAMIGVKFSGSSAMEQSLSKGEIVLIEDTAESPILSQGERERFQSANIHSTLIVPAIVREDYFATIGVDETRGKRTFTQREKDICKTLAAQVSIALKLNQITSYTRLREIQQEILGNIYDKNAVFELILKSGLAVIEAPVGELLIREADELIIQYSTIPSEIGNRLPVYDSITGLVVQSKKPLIINDIHNDQDYKKLYKHGEGGPMRSELAVPILKDKEVIGVINAESPEVGAFTEQDLDLWMILASQATLSIDVAQHFDEEKAIAEIRKEIGASQLEFDDLIQLILARMCGLIGARIGQLILIENERFVIAASTEEEDKGVVIAEDSVTGYVIRNDVSVNISDLKTDPKFKDIHKWYAKGEMRSELATPLKRGDEVIGALNLESPTVGAFSSADERALENFASEISFAIALSRQENIYRWLKKIQEAILGNPESFDIELIYHEIIQSGIDILKSQTGAVLRRRKGDKLEVVASKSAAGFGEVTRPIGTTYDIDNCISGFAILKEQIVNVVNVNEGPYKELYRTIGKNMLSNIVAPLKVQDRLIGVLSFESIRAGAFSVTDEPLLLELSRQAAIAIEKAELIEKLKVRESSKAEERFAIEVTHRLNNPLGAVRLWTKRADEYLQKGDFSKIENAMYHIRVNSEKAMKLVDDMRWKRREFLAQEINVDSYLNNFINSFEKDQGIPDGVKVVTKLNAGDISIRADELLSRVFQNIFENSIIAMDGAGVLEIGSQSEGDKVKIWVHDNGRGIPEKLIPDLFYEFVSTKPPGNEPSNGVGLWWCRQYVSAYHGTIDIESEHTRWTRVILVFPVAKPLGVDRLGDALLSLDDRS